MVVSLDGHGQTKAFVISRRRDELLERKSSPLIKNELKVSMLGVQGGKPGRVWQTGGALVHTDISLRETLEDLRKQAVERNDFFPDRLFAGFKRGDAGAENSKLIPFFAGVAPHGSQVEVIVTDLAGSVVGRSDIFADAAGNWTLSMLGTQFEVQPYAVEICLSLSTWEDSLLKSYRAKLPPELLEKIMRHSASTEEIVGTLIPVVSSEESFGAL